MEYSGKKALGEKLRKLRVKYNMTQDDIADVLGMSRTSFSKYENGAATPPLSVMKKLAALFMVPLEYLIYDDERTLVFNANFSGIEESDDDTISFAELTQEERLILMKYRVLNSDNRDRVVDFLDDVFEESNKDN